MGRPLGQRWGLTATTHRVGDSAGWTSTGHVDYQEWPARRNFHVGDALVFKYDNQFRNVKQVTRQDFESWDAAATNPIATYTSGYVIISLDNIGHYYFICGVPGHCLAGQKIHVVLTPPSSPCVI